MENLYQYQNHIKFCPNCGGELTETDKNCPFCGINLVGYNEQLNNELANQRIKAQDIKLSKGQKSVDAAIRSENIRLQEKKAFYNTRHGRKLLEFKIWAIVMSVLLLVYGIVSLLGALPTMLKYERREQVVEKIDAFKSEDMILTIEEDFDVSFKEKFDEQYTSYSIVGSVGYSEKTNRLIVQLTHARHDTEAIIQRYFNDNIIGSMYISEEDGSVVYSGFNRIEIEDYFIKSTYSPTEHFINSYVEDSKNIITRHNDIVVNGHTFEVYEFWKEDIVQRGKIILVSRLTDDFIYESVISPKLGQKQEECIQEILENIAQYTMITIKTEGDC